MERRLFLVEEVEILANLLAVDDDSEYLQPVGQQVTERLVEGERVGLGPDPFEVASVGSVLFTTCE